MSHDQPDRIHGCRKKGRDQGLPRRSPDDRRILMVGFPGAPLVSSDSPETDAIAAFAGQSEAARRLRGAADPAALQLLAELEVERLTRQS
ncbi:MAG: hypothetical protein ABI766_14765, partial [Gemmatimonadales bacterium]